MTKEIQKVNGNIEERTKTVRTITPAVDIQELADSYVVRLDIPGADKQTISARVNNSALTVTADAPAAFRQGAAFIRSESVPTEYRREFSLAENIDLHSIEAVYELGVLRITLKKKQQYLPREIKVL